MSEPWINQIISMQPALSEQDKLLRDAFVDKYMESENAIEAVIKLNYTRNYAEHIASQFMMDAYVLNLIEARKKQPPLDKQTLTNIITADLLRIGRTSLSDNARVSAYRLVAALHTLANIPDQEILDSPFVELTQEQYFAERNSRQLRAIDHMVSYDDVAE